MNNREPLVAFFLSILFCGLGQLYNGQWKKAVIFMVAFYLIYFVLGITGLFSKFYGLVIVLVLVLVYLIYVSYDAYKWAHKLKPFEIKNVNSWGYYFLFIVVWNSLIFSIPPKIKKWVGYEAFEIPTASMEPTINVGDKIVATKINPKQIQIGDIITFIKEDGQKYLSRVVGLPNQSIIILNDKVNYGSNSEQWIETKLSRDSEFEYQEYKSSLPNGRTFFTKKILKYNGMELPEQQISNMTIQTIPPNEYFVMGDNRNNSMDSRIIGTIKLYQIEKEVNYIWWSKNINKIGMRTDE